jgi:protein TonB
MRNTGSRASRTRWSGRTVAVLAALLLHAPSAAAQDKVYTPEQLTELPKIAAPKEAVAAIEEAYPADLKAKGVGGKVQLRLVLNADGSVDASSVKVVAATNKELGEAAARAVKRIRFEAGKVNGKAVRTVVMFPLAFGT